AASIRYPVANTTTIIRTTIHAAPPDAHIPAEVVTAGPAVGRRADAAGVARTEPYRGSGRRQPFVRRPGLYPWCQRPRCCARWQPVAVVVRRHGLYPTALPFSRTPPGSRTHRPRACPTRTGLIFRTEPFSFFS